MSAFMYDIIIWSHMLEGLHDATQEELRRLCDNRLSIAPDTYEWVQHQIEFLGYMVSGQGVEMTHEKVEKIGRAHV